MTARAFLVRGLLVGLLAGIATFVVAFSVGEPQVDRAIALESSASATSGDEVAEGEVHVHEDGTEHTHAADDESGGTTVTRDNQRTWGLATGTLAVGLAIGGIVALVSAAAVGRLGALTPSQSTAVVALVGFVAYTLVPFLKYPATPPAVGSGDTIGQRTGLYFAFVLISLVAAVVAVLLARRVHEAVGAYPAVVAGIGLYLVVVLTAGALLPTVNEVGDFPADTLWFFRRASLLTVATTWGVIGISLTGLVGRLWRTEQAVLARRELAASI